MNANYLKTLWKSSLMVLFLGLGLSSWGQTTVTSNFGATSGDIDGNISFTTQKNNAGNDPAWNTGSSELRLYYHSGGNGGSVTLHPAEGIVITNVILTSSTSPTVKYNVDGGSDETASGSGTYTISNIEANQSLRIRNANTSNVQLRLTGITVTYTIATSCEASNLTFTNTTVNKDLLDPSFTQAATSLNATTAITYESSDELVATVNATTGEVSLVGVGTATITATQEAGEHSGVDYCAGTATYDVVVTTSAPLLTVSTNSASFSGFAGGAVATEDVLVEGFNLTGDITLVLSGDTNFSIDPNTLSADGGDITITYTPSATPATHSATLTVSNGLLSEVITLNGVTNEMPEEYAGVGTFQKITSTDDLTDGYYVVARGTRAMSNSHTTGSGGNLVSEEITINDNSIINPNTAIVWKIETNDSGRVLYNEVVEQYVSSTSNSSNNISLSSTVTDTERFTATIVSTYFRFTNVGHTSRLLQRNTGATGPFRWYGTNSSQLDLELYKLTPPSTDPLFTVSETELTGFNYVANGGPSASQSFVVSGENLDGSAITVTAPANFEVSTDDVAFDSSLNLSSTEGTLAATTVYVRLVTGLTANTYNGNITISGGTAPEVSVAVSGEVIDYCMPTSEANDESGITSVSFADINNTSVGDPLYSDFTDITTQVIAGNSYDLIVGVNTFEENTYIVKAWIDWNKNYVFEADEQYNVGNAYNNGTTSPFSITIPVDTEVGEYRMRIRTMWEPSGVLLTACGEFDYTETEDYTITVIPTPSFSLSVNSIAGFTYVAGSGPSNSESFTVSGVNLDGSAITVTAPANFEVSADDETFASSLNLSSTDGTLGATTIYVRLADELEAGEYNGNITISGGTAPEVTVAVSGEVTCATATFEFAEETVSKTTDDVAFINEFTTNNTSATVFASSNTAVASVDASTGEVTIVGAGSTTISVTQLADGTYCAVSTSYELNVTTLEPLLVFSGNTDMGSTCFQGEAIQTEYTVTNNGGSTANNVVFLNSNPAFHVFPPVVAPQNIAPGNSFTFTVTFNPMMGALPNTNNNTLTAMSNGTTLASHNITATVNMPISGDVETNAATSETETGVTFNGQITDLGTCWNVTEYGFVYATTPNPTNANFSIIAGTNPSFATPFQFTLDGVLTPGTTYYYKAYVKYSQGFADYYHYGNEESFITTLSTPTATAATNVSSNSFTANWNAVAGATSYELNVWTVTTSPSLELVNDGDFEVENLNAWTFANNLNQVISTQQAHSGTKSLLISSDHTSGNREISQIVSVNPGEQYKISFWYYADTTSSNNAFRLWASSPNVQLPSSSTYYGGTKGSWQFIEQNFTASENGSFNLVFRFYNGAKIYLDDVSVKLVSGESTTVSILNENLGNVTSYQVTGLDSETTYYYTVKAKTSAKTSDTSNEIIVTTLAAPIITWTTENVWSNGDGPTVTDDVIIEGDNYVVTGNVAAKTLTVANGGKITIPENAALTVEGKITNNGEFIINHEGLLYQNNFTGANEGDITVERDAKPMRRLDYTLWSSPVSGMLLNQFSNISNNGGTGTIWNRVYELGATAWESVWDSYANATASTETFATAKGYLYRAFNSYDPTTPTTFVGEFTGVPNNGDYTINTPNMFDAIGNPYPSPVFAEDFFNANVGAGAIYFWTNVNPSNGVAYTYNNWASYTLAGGVGVQAEGVGEEIEVPNGWIHPGVGFVVYTEESTASVVLNNGMRINTNGALGREMATEKSRFWLNLSNEEVVFNQILVGYMDNATQGVDTGIDGKMFAYEGNALYSIIENSEDNYVIQGRSLPFTDSDVVTLGFRAVNSGSFTISLNNFDGLFADNQNIYLKDNFTQAVHNLKDGAYTFVSEEGVFNTRFEVVYQTTMSVENPVANNANWVVYSQENGYQIQTQGFELKTVQVFDLLGRTIYTANAQGTAHNIPSLGADSVYIVKVTTTDNVVLSKKVK